MNHREFLAKLFGNDRVFGANVVSHRRCDSLAAGLNRPSSLKALECIENRVESAIAVPCVRSNIQQGKKPRNRVIGESPWEASDRPCYPNVKIPEQTPRRHFAHCSHGAGKPVAVSRWHRRPAKTGRALCSPNPDALAECFRLRESPGAASVLRPTPGFEPSEGRGHSTFRRTMDRAGFFKLSANCHA